MKYKAVSFKKEGHLAILQFAESPQKRNHVLSLSFELSDICGELNSDPDIRVVAVFGAENLKFSPNSDETEGYLIPAETSQIQFPSVSEPIAAVECPVILGIDGYLSGPGLEMALAGDIRISSEGSIFCLPHVAMGFIPWDGGTQRLSRIVGKAKTLEIILTGEAIDATEAFRLGIVSSIVPSNKVKAVVRDAAQKMAAKGPIALKYAKEAIVKGLDMSLEQGLRLEADLYALLQTTSDRTEGIEAFRRKTKPEFQGK